MPKKLNENYLRNWYSRFSQELRKHASIDVTRVADLARVKNFAIRNWQSSTDIAAYDVVEIEEPTYAYMPHNGTKCLLTPPDNEDHMEYVQWLLDNVQTNISLEHIQNLYDMSQAGTLMISRPGEGERRFMQVYTDGAGHITTSWPFEDAEDRAREITERLIKEEEKRREALRAANPNDPELQKPIKKPHWAGAPEYVPPVDPVSYGLPPKPVKPVRPKNMNPGFLSWLGNLFGRETDYTRKKRYEKEQKTYPERLQEWEETIESNAGYAEYMVDVALREQFERDLEVYKSSPIGIQYAISAGYQGYMADERRPKLKDFGRIGTLAHLELQKEHFKTPLGKISKGLADIRAELDTPKLTKKALNHLLGLHASPDALLVEWQKKGVFERKKFVPGHNDAPKGFMLPETEIPFAETRKREAWWFDTYYMSSLLSLGALGDEKIIGAPVEENFSKILKGLFTVGVPGSTDLLEHLNPAREKAAATMEELLMNKNSEPASKLLGNALRLLNQEVAKQTNLLDDHAYHTLYIIDQIQTMMNKRPALASDLGLNEQERHELDANLETFRVLRTSKESQKSLIEHALSRKTLTPYGLQEAVTDICFAKIVTKLTAEGNKVDLTNPQSVAMARKVVADLCGVEKIHGMDREGIGALVAKPFDFHRAFPVKPEQFADGLKKAAKQEAVVQNHAEPNHAEHKPLGL